MDVKRGRQEKDETYKGEQQSTSSGRTPRRWTGVAPFLLASNLDTVGVWQEKRVPFLVKINAQPDLGLKGAESGERWSSGGPASAAAPYQRAESADE